MNIKPNRTLKRRNKTRIRPELHAPQLIIAHPLLPCRTWGVVLEAVLPSPSLPWSPSPKDQTVLPSADTASVWFRPQATWRTAQETRGQRRRRELLIISR